MLCTLLGPEHESKTGGTTIPQAPAWPPTLVTAEPEDGRVSQAGVAEGNSPSPDVTAIQTSSENDGPHPLGHETLVIGQSDQNRPSLSTRSAMEHDAPEDFAATSDSFVRDGDDSLFLETNPDEPTETQPLDQPGVTPLAIPSQSLNKLAERHALSNRVVTAAWVLLRLARQDTPVDSSASVLETLAKDLVGARAFDELASMK